MPRASRGFSDCRVQHTPGTGARCLRQPVPLHHPPSVSANSWVVMETQPAQREPRWAPVTHPAVHSQVLSHSSHSTQHEVGVQGASFLQTSYRGLVFCRSYTPSPTLAGQAAAWRRGGRLLAAATPDLRGCAGDITL